MAYFNGKGGFIAAGKISQDLTNVGEHGVRFSMIIGKEPAPEGSQYKTQSKFMSVTIWEGETAKSILQKGDSVLVMGQLETREYQGKNYTSLNCDFWVPSGDVINALIPEDAEQVFAESDKMNSPATAPAPAIEYEDDGELPF